MKFLRDFNFAGWRVFFFFFGLQEQIFAARIDWNLAWELKQQDINKERNVIFLTLTFSGKTTVSILSNE